MHPPFGSSRAADGTVCPDSKHCACAAHVPVWGLSYCPCPLCTTNSSRGCAALAFCRAPFKGILATHHLPLEELTYNQNAKAGKASKDKRSPPKLGICKCQAKRCKGGGGVAPKLPAAAKAIANAADTCSKSLSCHSPALIEQ